MSSATEAKFRITAPNSLPRNIKLIALDPRSERVLEQIARQQWKGASFLTGTAFSSSAGHLRDFSLRGWLNDLAGRTRDHRQ
jgi:hypothetical protein